MGERGSLYCPCHSMADKVGDRIRPPAFRSSGSAHAALVRCTPVVRGGAISPEGRDGAKFSLVGVEQKSGSAIAGPEKVRDGSTQHGHWNHAVGQLLMEDHDLESSP